MKQFPVSMLVVSALLLFGPSLVPTGQVEAQKKSDQPDPGPVTPPYLKLPATKAVKIANRNFYLKPDTNCTTIKWIIPSGIEQDTEVVLKDPSAVALYGPDGTYTVSAYGCLNNQLTDPAICTVTVGAVPPGPTPPGPTPPGPTPPNPLTQTLQTALNLDTDANKLALAQTLGQQYGAAVTGSNPTINEASITTLSDLFKVMATASDSLVPSTALPNFRTALNNYLNGQIGTNGAQALDAATKAKVTASFNAVSTAVGGLK